MPHSLRAKLSGLRHKGILEDKDYKRLCHALDLEKAEQESYDDTENDSNYKDMRIKGLERDKAMYLEMLKAYEEELRKHIPEEEFTAFATKIAKSSFLAEVMASPNEDFRNTVLENWDYITRD